MILFYQSSISNLFVIIERADYENRRVQYGSELLRQYPVRGSFTGFLYTLITQRDVPCTHCPL